MFQYDLVDNKYFMTDYTLVIKKRRLGLQEKRLLAFVSNSFTNLNPPQKHTKCNWIV